MLKYQQPNDDHSMSAADQDHATENANSSPSVSNSTFSANAASTEISVIPNGSVQSVGVNGINNNHDHGEESEEMSSVVIEVGEHPMDDEILLHQINDDMIVEEIETNLDDGAGSSSQDDGMISSAATSSSGSSVSVDREPPISVPAPVLFAAAAAVVTDQPEVADFLDMDFDVEPTSTDEDEETDRAAAACAEKSKKDFLNIGSLKNSNGLGHLYRFERKSQTWEDMEEPDYSEPSTSYSNGASSTAPKSKSSSTGPVTCVQGCWACTSDGSSRRRQRVVPIASGKPPILGDLPSSSTAAASSSAAASNLSSVPARSASPRFYSRIGQRLGYLSRLRCSRAVVNVGGPDGLRFARSAYVGFPNESRRVSGEGPDYSAFLWYGNSDATFRIWTVEEAETMQTTQIGPSMCGATALINVLRALGVEKNKDNEFFSVRDVERAVPTRQRANDAPLAEYLLSRSVAGTDAEDLIEAMDVLTDSKVIGRFFPMTEKTMEKQPVDLLEDRFGRWLLHWLKRGAVPILTLNMQRGLLPIEPMPDAWHHQMAFGVCLRTGSVFLTNPMEIVPLHFLKHALCSPSVLLVKVEDIRERWNGRFADLSPLLGASGSEQSADSRPVQSTLWTEMNVIGQIARALRQAGQNENSTTEPLLTHVAIPARYRSGVSLYALAGSETWTAISGAPEIDEALTAFASTDALDRRDFQTDEGASSSVVITMGDDAVGSSEERNLCEDEAFRFSSDDDDVDEDVYDYEDGEHGENSQSCSTM